MTAIEPYRGESERPSFAPPPSEPQATGDRIDIGGLLAAFRRRMDVFLITMAATLAFVVLFMLVYPAQYTATARVAVEARTIAATPEKETPVVSQLSTVQASDVETEAQVVQSVRVVERVIDKLHLDQDPEFNGAKLALKGKVTQFLLKMFAPPASKSQRDEIVAAVLGKLQPAQYLTTNAIDINFTDHNARKAQKIANAFAQAYLDDQVAAKLDQSRKASEGLLAQIEAMRRQAESDAEKVQAYKISHGLLSLGAQTLTQQEISTYDESIATAKAEAAGDLASLRTAQEQLAKGSNGDDVGQALSSTVVGNLREQRAELSAKLALLEGHYGPKYPDLAQARQQLADIDREIKAEIQRTISNLAAKSAVSQQRLATMESTLATTRQTLAQNNAALSGLEDLQRRATVSQQIYEAYLDRAKESVAQASNLLPDSEIVSRATLPEYPSFPNTILFLALGVVAGFLFGCAGVLIAEMTDDRFVTGADIERRLGRQYLGSVPLLSSGFGPRRLAPEDASIADPSSAFSEALRAIQAAIGLSASDAASQVVLFTSALPQEGKTTTCVGLARTSSLQSVATVMVDCDVRRRGLTRMLRLDGMGPGLLEVLRGQAPLSEALLPDISSGALVLPMSRAQNPAHELLSGTAMDSLLEQLRERFQVIVLDAPPILPVAATRVLATKADASVLIVRWRKTKEDAARSALRLLVNGRSRMAGVILARVDMRQMAKYVRTDIWRIFKKSKQNYA
jgi:capsular exopolysaccharide synthesis family protein